MTASIAAVSLLVFEAADRLMAVPASEIGQLEGSDPIFTKIENRAAFELGAGVRGEDVFLLLDPARLTS
jgi:hypothetical protein